jgi:hypothetical protein
MVAELQRHAEDLEKKIAERTEALQRSNDELRQFAYIASHDLQEPLRTISSYLQLIENRYPEKLDEDGREFIAFAVDAAARMKDLIHALLSYSRVEAQMRPFVMVDCQQVIEELQKFLAVSIDEAGATIRVDPLPCVKGDKDLLLQLFQNLIGNAIKYRGENKPEIHIGTKREKAFWVFSVQDNGIGIEPQYLERIFVIFQRLHHRNQYSGTGIGLAVCKKVVELHGGRIWAESQAGQGTQILFTIPASD